MSEGGSDIKATLDGIQRAAEERLKADAANNHPAATAEVIVGLHTTPEPITNRSNEARLKNSALEGAAAKSHFEALDKLIQSGVQFGGRRGTRNPQEIRLLQEALAATDHGKDIVVNGNPNDPATTKAIKALQVAYTGKSDAGIFGRHSLEMLKADYKQHVERIEPKTAAKDDWKPFHERQGNGPVFDLLMPNGERKPILINPQGDLKVPDGFQKTDANYQRILEATRQNASDRDPSAPKYNPFPLQGTLPLGDKQEPVAGMKAGVALVRRDNPAGNPVVNGKAMARPGERPADMLPGDRAVSVDVRKAIEDAIAKDGVISAQPVGHRSNDATRQIAADLRKSGVVYSTPQGRDAKVDISELGALNVIAQHLESASRGPSGMGQDPGQGPEGGGRGGSPGRGA